jgi:hypothetical protein
MEGFRSRSRVLLIDHINLYESLPLLVGVTAELIGNCRERKHQTLVRARRGKWRYDYPYFFLDNPPFLSLLLKHISTSLSSDILAALSMTPLPSLTLEILIIALSSPPLLPVLAACP